MWPWPRWGRGGLLSPRRRVAGTTRVGAYDAVIPEVSGTAFITGRSEFLIDPRDALGGGFL